MADAVNLDALMIREQFDSEEGAAAGQSGKTRVGKTDLTKGESFYMTLRKPDFQRETAAWAPEAVYRFLASFIDGDLIPAVICWQSASRLTFVIDGAHRLSAVIGWLLDDYGGGDESIKFYNNRVPPNQMAIHEKTKALIDEKIGSYKAIMAETQHPNSNPKLSERARSLGNATIPLLWVPGNDSERAERAFLTINQSAVEIDPTEFTILNSRNKPNAISSRAIVRNGTGYRYWKDFSSDGQNKVESTGKSIYAALYNPPLDPPIRTPDLPIAGHGYGSQTLPLIFDFVNIANDIPVVDTSRKNKRTFEVIKEEPDETATISCLGKTQKMTNRLTGTDSASLGLHPAVYFYAPNSRHQPTTVLAIAAFLKELETKDLFLKFTDVRESFENFLVEHKMYVNQLTIKHGSMAKGFRSIKDLYTFVFERLMAGDSSGRIEERLREHDRFQILVKERPTLTKQNKKFSGAVKDTVVISDVLANASLCELCHARIDLKSVHVDHIQDRSKGGLGTVENARLLHPYCDSTYKYYLEKKNALLS